MVLCDDMPVVDWCFFAWCFGFAAAPLIESANAHSDTIMIFFIDLVP